MPLDWLDIKHPVITVDNILKISMGASMLLLKRFDLRSALPTIVFI